MEERSKRTETDLESSPPPATDGLGPLDRDRALSLADEGGMSASGVESQELQADDERRAARMLAIFTLAVVALWSLQQAFRRRRRDR
jgi:hypothetical protein